MVASSCQTLAKRSQSPASRHSAQFSIRSRISLRSSRSVMRGLWFIKATVEHGAPPTWHQTQRAPSVRAPGVARPSGAGYGEAQMQVLDERQAGLVRSVCELIVPGCARTGAEVYVDALLAHMPDADRDHALAAFEALAEPAAAGPDKLGERQLDPRVPARAGAGLRGLLQRLRGPGRVRARRLAGDRLRPTAGHAAEQGLVVPGSGRMNERFDVVVVGSGAGGGVVAGELAEAGVSVLLLESGPAQDGRRLHALGGACQSRAVVAAGVRRAARPRRAAADHASAATASAAPPRSTPRSRYGRRRRTTRSGTGPAGCSATAANRSPRATCSRTSSAPNAGWGCANAATGNSASRP